MNGEDHVSVVLPTYNREDTLEEAARSVLSQSHRELTLYIIDDASTDRTIAVVRALDDDRVVLLERAENGGVCRARNDGLSAATTSLVAFMDSDDAWLPEKLAAQLRALREAQQMDDRIGVVGCGWILMGAQTPNRVFTGGPFTREDVLRRRVSGVGTPMLLVDRSVTVRDARFDPSFPALVENDYLLSVLANDTKLIVVPETLAHVRRGRADHVASSLNAAASYERFMVKHRDELRSRPDLWSWFAFRACREYLISGQPSRCRPHIRRALRCSGGKRAIHLAFGAVSRRYGLAVAGRVFPL